MSMEQELFRCWQIQPEKLLLYGFQPDGDKLVFETPLPEERLRIFLTYDGELRGQIRDDVTGEEYTLYRVQTTTGFSAEVRQKYRDLLLDIRARCCKNLHFRTAQARRIGDFIFEAYHGSPEFLWPSLPTYAAFRRDGSKKWYAIIGSVPRRKIDAAADSNEPVEVINVKVDNSNIREILNLTGYYPAYHMNKKCWVSIILDDTLSDEEIRERVRDSFRSV